MQVIDDLRQAGFDIWVDEENIRYKQKDKSEIDNAWLDNVLTEISANKAKIIEYLRQIEQKPIDKSKKPEVITHTAEGWKSIDDCPGCRCYIHWEDYPLNGGEKAFCGYWVLTEGKAKKVELLKLRSCPKEPISEKAA